ncbi:hypothetical protein [Caenibius sp. WL]|uniref:hypothetical protein n=1 Tax=Caenibius sp. WL TaxID=2872646 RepID=UPI001C99D0F8|nr:hypothetical protein [Caenibius sp. WL]QZP06809.1 hypothetical protein K5X80_08715 [Caenibius sp. WL]
MAKFSPTSARARLRSLEKAKERAAALKRGETMTAQPMAKFLGVSWPVLRGWCDEVEGFEQSGAFERGANGIEYTFRPRKTVDHLLKHFKTLADTAAARSRRTKRIIAGAALDAVPDDYSIDEMNKMFALSMRVQESRERQGQLVEAGSLLEMLRRVFSEMQQAALRAVQEHDPTGQWPVEVRENVENVSRSILLAQERAAQRCLRNMNGGAARSG